jgi:hypothetical protein
MGREQTMERTKYLLTVFGNAFALLLPAETVSADPGTLPPGQFT